MAERPILFSGPMVRAILDGRKTVTRRALKPAPFEDGYYQGEVCLDVSGPASQFSVEVVGGGAFLTEIHDCPYGELGDRLWVREAWRVPDSLDASSGSDIAEKCIGAGYRNPWAPIRFEADGALNSARDWQEFGSTPGEATLGRYRHARFMPRWASRITLELTAVRVERLQDISEEQALAEGASLTLLPAIRVPKDSPMARMPSLYADGRDIFSALWESINGAGSWAANPWVWVVEFKRIEKEVPHGG